MKTQREAYAEQVKAAAATDARESEARQEGAKHTDRYHEARDRIFHDEMRKLRGEPAPKPATAAKTAAEPAAPQVKASKKKKS